METSWINNFKPVERLISSTSLKSLSWVPQSSFERFKEFNLNDISDIQTAASEIVNEKLRNPYHTTDLPEDEEMEAQMEWHYDIAFPLAEQAEEYLKKAGSFEEFKNLMETAPTNKHLLGPMYSLLLTYYLNSHT